VTSRGPVHVRWEGLAELQAALRRVKGKLDKKAVREAGKLIVRAEVVPPVRGGAPVGPTGNLGRSVRAAFSASRVQLLVGTEKRVPYAGPINFGWAARGISAQEFIYSGIDRAMAGVERGYVDFLDGAVRDVAPAGRL
jgi:hypothetical protein